ncbi:MAG TPA: tetratricopeptide repeat protein [Terriglobia bacterium]|nr:tetratricopeptide repeat protein [Terriglobia bacterium]
MKTKPPLWKSLVRARNRGFTGAAAAPSAAGTSGRIGESETVKKDCLLARLVRRVAATASVFCILLPAPGLTRAQNAGNQASLADYEQRLKANPDDVDALEAIARVEAARKNFAPAIAAYQRIVTARPQDRAARIQLARLLGWNHQYPESIRAYQAALAQAPDDAEALEGQAAVEEWSGKIADAAAIYGRLASAHPENVTYIYRVARLEAAGSQYPVARDRLATVLALDPEQLDARLLLAQLELKTGQYSSATRQFERVLARRPADPDALMGAAQARYYTGDLGAAYVEASRVVRQQPQNFDAIYLLASIERARGHRHQATLLLNRAHQLSRHNAEVASLRKKLADDSSTVLHLTAAYTHEDQPGFFGSMAEDLHSLAFGSRLDFVVLPRTASSFSANALPSESPSGILRGAVAPTEFLYRQTTRAFKGLTLRGGVGMEHFGPGVPVTLPKGSGLQPGATSALVGFLGGTYALNAAWSFDLTWSHLALPYTPLAVRLGVVSTRNEGGVNWTPDPRTGFHLTYFQEHLASEPYRQISSAVSPGTGLPKVIKARSPENGSGGTLSFNRRVIDGERLALDLGASAFLEGYDGPRRNVDLGFFTPGFYQRELLNGRLSGRLSKHFGYDLAGSFGVQQVDRKQALKHALALSPTLKFNVTPYVGASVGYIYYDSAQTLGLLRGNGVRAGIDWKF